MGILYAAFLHPCFFRKGRLQSFPPPSFTGLVISAVLYFALCYLLFLFLLIYFPWDVSRFLFLFPLYPLCFLSAVLSFSFVLFSAVLNFTYFIPLGCLPLLAFILLISFMFLSAALPSLLFLLSAVLNFAYFIPLSCLLPLAFIHPVFRSFCRLPPIFLRHSALLLCFPPPLP